MNTALAHRAFMKTKRHRWHGATKNRDLLGRLWWALISTMTFVVLPLLTIINQDEDFLVVRGVGRPTLLVALILATVVVFACTAIVVLAAWRMWSRLPVVGLLAAVLMYGAAKPNTPFSLFGMSRPVAIVVAILVGALFEVLARKEHVGRVVLVSAIAIMLASAIFQGPPGYRGAEAGPLAIASAENLPSSVVWIVMDEVGANLVYDQDGVRRELPSLHRLSQSATTFTKTVTPFHMTTQSVPAMLSGVDSATDIGQVRADDYGIFPSSDAGIPRYFYSEVLTSPCGILGEDPLTGCSGGVNMSRAYVLFADMFAIVGRNSLPLVRLYLPNTNDKVKDYFGLISYKDKDSLGSLATFIEGQGPDQKFFAFHHYLRTHFPWNLDREGNALWRDVPEIAESGRFDTEALVDLRQKMRFEALLRFDRELEKVITALKQRDLFDSSMIVVTGDHGAVINPGGFLAIADRLSASDDVTLTNTAHIPLIVKYPNQRERRIVFSVHAPGHVARWLQSLGNEGVEELRTDTLPELSRGAVFGVLNESGDLGDQVPLLRLAELPFVPANVGDPLANRRPRDVTREPAIPAEVEWLGSDDAKIQLVRVTVASATVESGCATFSIVSSDGAQEIGEVHPEQWSRSQPTTRMWGFAFVDKDAELISCVAKEDGARGGN